MMKPTIHTAKLTTSRAFAVLSSGLVNLETGKTAETFINHAGEILDRDRILNILWDDVGGFVNDNTLTVYIKRLRNKLGDDDGVYIETLRGQGYRLNL